MLDQQGVTRIGDAARCRIEQSELAIRLSQQHHATIAGHASAIKPAFHDTPTETAKINLLGSNFFGTVWHWRSCVVIGLRYQ
jgi:hypothetical protein